MKKLVIATVVAAMVMALALPAMAAPQLTTGGSIETNLNYTKDSGMTSESEIKFNVNLALDEGAGNAKLHIEFAPINREKKDSFGSLTPFGSALDLSISKAYLQTSGALWHNGPEMDITLGDVDVNYSDWIAVINGVEGIKVDQIDIANNTIDVFHIWDAASDVDADQSADKVVGVNGKTNLAGLDLSGAIVKRLTDGNTTYVANAKVSPVDNVTVDGTIAYDNANSARAVVVESTVTSIPNYTIKAGYRNLDEDFAPPYAAQEDPDKGRNEQPDVVRFAGQTGYNAEVSTTIANFDITGKLDRYNTSSEQMRTVGLALGTTIEGFDLSLEHNINTDLAANASTTDSTLVAQRGFVVADHEIQGKYTYKTNPNAVDGERKHTVEASTRTDVAALKDVELAAKLQSNGGLDSLNYNVKASYDAPNGMSFGAEYDGEAGFSANAGMKVTF
ncbi:MAG: hypothetical protein WBH35_01355 [Bacillota bacterium]|jgi:hypothetical protein|nr:hypothetical protein [Bacillota bacterium]HOB91598.1 hypothetical protein [Bacillota bacterium]HPZ54484.1 hypothetical protein [Bacillota bacterium]HQD17820.1 hypothetical protein [Bacillota bacterium]